MKTCGFRYLDHTADTMVEAYGSSLEEAFENSGRALVNIMFEVDKVDSKNVARIDVQGSDMENLLYSWLEKILLLVLVDEFIPSEFNSRIFMANSKISLTGLVKGETIDLQRHAYRTEVKGITFHEMSIEQENNKFKIRYIVDL